MVITVSIDDDDDNEWMEYLLISFRIDKIMKWMINDKRSDLMLI